MNPLPSRDQELLLQLPLNHFEFRNTAIYCQVAGVGHPGCSVGCYSDIERFWLPIRPLKANGVIGIAFEKYADTVVAITRDPDVAPGIGCQALRPVDTPATAVVGRDWLAPRGELRNASTPGLEPAMD